MKYTVTRKQLQEIYPNVCGYWQSKINKVASLNPLEDVAEVSEELIREAYGEANKSQKKWLNKVFPNFLPKVEVGKWYKGKVDKLIFTTSEEQDGHVKAFGFGAIGEWFKDDNTFCWRTDDLKEATKEEVEQALVKEAKRRGLVEGARVDFEVRKDDIRILKGDYTLDLLRGWFAIGDDIIFHFGRVKAGHWNDKVIKEPEIDYSRLKTGSKVMIKKTEQEIMYGSIDYSTPVEIVFYRTPYHIDEDKEFKKDGIYKEYITFYQNGNYILFASDDVIDYITEVIEY